MPWPASCYGYDMEHSPTVWPEPKGASDSLGDVDDTSRNQGGPCVLGGKYLLGELIGRGAHSAIHAATDTDLGRKVAIKLFTGDVSDFELLRRLEREANIIARLRHPNIVSIHGIGYTESGAIYLVLEYLEGLTLGGEIERNGPLEPQQAVAIFFGVCRGVAAAHEAGVVHRDLKPDNIFLAGRPVVPKILDFGVAKILAAPRPKDSAPTTDTLTRPGHIIGTPYYMAPEQILGESPDPRTDIYALGCVLYHMLTGRPPFTERVKNVLWRRHLMDTPALPSSIRPGIPDNVERAVMKALSKDPLDRFASAREMGEAIGVPRRRATDPSAGS